ncbi:hypothetical protein EVAR_103423_1 [Eumeta japonica]|uniref:Uncharacterized protein n=1 Tax=Eumeta variegata TaxID=151549 RepID=A0A4C1ZCA2_EUMVA|nr:hypothetical protein EVAR_103423_1 [Eumeta japonica]
MDTLNVKEVPSALLASLNQDKSRDEDGNREQVLQSESSESRTNMRPNNKFRVAGRKNTDTQLRPTRIHMKYDAAMAAAARTRGSSVANMADAG